MGGIISRANAPRHKRDTQQVPLHTYTAEPYLKYLPSLSCMQGRATLLSGKGTRQHRSPLAAWREPT